MSQAGSKSDLLIFVATALATIVGLFGARTLYGSYIDRAYHAELYAAGPSQVVLDARAAESKLLASGKIPIEVAKKLVADKGRSGIGSVIAVQSDDLSAISGWVQRPGFKPAVAHPIRLARAPLVAEPSPVVADPNAALAPEAAPATATPAQPAAAH